MGLSTKRLIDKRNYNFNMKRLLFTILSFCFLHLAFSQDPVRFQQEVNELSHVKHQIDPNKETVVFAGSSSFRMWKDAGNYFPQYNVINSGFGGSQMSDLLYYADTLIIKFNPDIIFIYEGDNDLESGKTPEEIIETTKLLLALIEHKLPGAGIFIFSAKPSPARWGLKDKYLDLNGKFEALVKAYPNVYFINVWDVLLDKSGGPNHELFIEDNLHLNKKGYELWAKVILEYLNTNYEN